MHYFVLHNRIQLVLAMDIISIVPFERCNHTVRYFVKLFEKLNQNQIDDCCPNNDNYTCELLYGLLEENQFSDSLKQDSNK